MQTLNNLCFKTILTEQPINSGVQFKSTKGNLTDYQYF